MNTKFLFFICLQLLLFSSNISFGQQNFATLPAAKDSTYGYTLENPLPLKKGNMQKSIVYSRTFLSGLKASNNQDLIFLFRSSRLDPNFKKPLITSKNGMPLNGKLGIIDVYTFVTSQIKDTVTLFVDIYNKGELAIPKGLTYSP